MQITAKRLHDRLLDRSPEKVRIRIADRRSFDNLRTALVKLNRIARDLLDAGNLCSDWDEAAGIGAFWVGDKRRKDKMFEILTEDGGENGQNVRRSLEDNQGSLLGGETGEIEMPPGQSPEIAASDPEREVSRELETGSDPGRIQARAIDAQIGARETGSTTYLVDI